jgi:hypothetical protein
MTKHLSRVDADRHLAGLGMHLGGGRAAAAPTLGKFEARIGEHTATRRSNRFTKTHPTDFLSRSLRNLHPWLASVIGSSAALGTTLVERA